MSSSLKCVFFDIGGTLGNRDPATGKLVVFPDTIPILRGLRDQLGLRIGIITSLGGLSNDEGKALLERAGLAEFIDARGFVSEHDVNGNAKPSPLIYRHAAQQVGVSIGECLFVGENLVEVIGARAAGMQALLKTEFVR